VSVEVRGADQLARLSKQLKEAGNKDLQRELSRAIAQALKPLKADLQESARTTLPRRGGLGERIARSKFRTRRNRQGLRLQAVSQDSIRKIDRGFVRHPVFGNREVWRGQRVAMGWWSKPVEAAAPKVRRELEQAMDRVAKKIVRGI
jgi:hypothetical protein